MNVLLVRDLIHLTPLNIRSFFANKAVCELEGMAGLDVLSLEGRIWLAGEMSILGNPK
jgi:hypothetical protein